jgi:two-component system, chemotaxis family, chemotaxis protein CheY
MDKILIVDDDQESRELLCEVLDAHGYAVYAAEDGVTARQVLHREPDCRIVIADVQMPRETGLEFLRKLRKDNSKHDVILMSSFMSSGEVHSARALGAYALLDKPFQLEELLRTVAELAAQGSTRVAV